MAINGSLKFLVLKILSKKPKTGKDIRNLIQEKTGWKTSPGSFYPLMKELSELNFVTFEKDANIKTYKITKKGNNFLKEADYKKEEILKKIEEGMSLLNAIGEDKCAKDLIKRIQGRSNLEDEFIPIEKNLYDLKKEIFKQNIKKDHKNINKILEETIQKLQEIKWNF